MSSRDSNDAAARAGRRASWPIRKLTLGEDGEDLSDVTTPAERLAMMETLALDAWASAGRPLPTYDRAEMPGRVVRRSHGSSGAQ